jgi:agmatinase
MSIPHVEPFRGALARKPRDPNDPRAYDAIQEWKPGAALAKTVLLGVPFDGAVQGRKGAALGPAAIRESLRFSSAYHWESDTEIPDGAVSDVGDVHVSNADTALTHARVQEAVAHILSQGSHPLVIGGDNSITYATVKAVASLSEGRVGVLDLDAHLDVRDPRPVVSSGTPFRRLLEDETAQLSPANLAQIGHRQFANSRPYRKWAERQGVRLFPMTEVRMSGFETVLEEALAAAGDGTDHIVLSVDMDALDQMYAPGVSAPTPSGLSPSDLFMAARRLAKEPRCRLFEIVEVAPNLDPTGNTARLAAVALLEHVAARSRPPKRS